MNAPMGSFRARLADAGLYRRASVLSLRFALLAACCASFVGRAFAQLEPPARVTSGRLRIEVQRLMNVATPHYIYMDTANDDSGRMFFVEQGAVAGDGGIMVRQSNGTITTFLDLSSEIMRVGPMGVLGLAFHPGFANPTSPGYRKLYTFHTVAPDAEATLDFTAPSTIYNHNIVTEWQVDANNANIVDVSTRREVFRQGHVDPLGLHQGGMLEFGPDGYLYGVIGNPSQGASLVTYAQNMGIMQGKMFRIDPLAPSATPTSSDLVSANGKYRVPADNPFVDTPGALDEIYAMGTRNVHRFSIDPETGDLFAGDVGNALREELNAVTPGANLGWPYYEANRNGIVTPPANLMPPHSPPLANYTHDDGRAIVAGYTYRGSVPELQGLHIFGEFSWRATPDAPQGYDQNSGRIFVTNPYDEEGDLKSPVDFVIEDVLRGRVSCAESLHSNGSCAFDGTLYSLAQDDDGEIYFLARRSNRTLLYKIVGAYTLAEGDYNEDGVVDSLDYVQWRNTLGQTVSVFGRQADGDRDGVIDEDDFLIWKNHYGEVQQGGTGLGGLAMIPEPSVLVLLTGIACALPLRWRRRNLQD